MRRFKLWSVLLFISPALVMAQDKNSTDKNAEIIPVMHRVYGSLEVVLPLSLQGEKFVAPKNKDVILKNLAIFEQNAAGLEKHFANRGPDYRYLSKSLARDAREARRLFQDGRYPQARFVIHHVASNCVSCHTKLPSHSRATKKELMFRQLESVSLSKFELAQFKTMTRDFDAATKLYEDGIMQDLNALGSRRFTDYLKVALRVNLDTKRVDAFLLKVQNSGRLNQRLLQLVSSWKKTLEVVNKKKLLETHNLKSVEELLTMGDERIKNGFRNEGHMYFICASSVANQVLDEKAGKLTNNEKSGLYLLLGKSERHISDSFWLSEMENYLEFAIRLAPKTQYAKQAYQILEDNYIFGYTGSSGTNLPDDVVALLTELRNLAGVPKSASKM